MDILANVGYRVVSLKPIARFLPDFDKLLQAKVKPTEIITFSRQLALLLESGVGIVQSLELLQGQASNKQLKKVLLEVVSDLRSGNSLSTALAKHPQVFSTIYQKMVAVGEQTGALEGVLRN
ncbi:MAG: type II secretion system F family protein, partial [Dehalococcoidia bacterium]